MMKKQYTFLFAMLFLLVTSISLGQGYTVDWSQTYGGSLDDVPNQMIATNDGGFEFQ